MYEEVEQVEKKVRKNRSLPKKIADYVVEEIAEIIGDDATYVQDTYGDILSKGIKRVIRRHDSGK